MAEVKDKSPERAPTFEFNEKNTKKIGDGIRQLIFENFGSLGFATRILTFKNAKGLERIDLMLPALGNISCSSSCTSRIKYSGPLADLQVDFVRPAWTPESGQPWHIEPSAGWSFELSIEFSTEDEKTEEKKVSEEAPALCPKCDQGLSMGEFIHKCRKCRIFVCCGAVMSHRGDDYACITCKKILQCTHEGYRVFFKNRADTSYWDHR